MTLYVDIRDKVARLIRGGFIICDNSDYVVNFTFDSEWDAMETKTARFIYGDTYEDTVTYEIVKLANRDIYLKQNGAYKQAQNAYKTVSGVWVKQDASTLKTEMQSGKYILG